MADKAFEQLGAVMTQQGVINVLEEALEDADIGKEIPPQWRKSISLLRHNLMGFRHEGNWVTRLEHLAREAEGKFASLKI
jgi:hypothetical protein